MAAVIFFGLFVFLWLKNKIALPLGYTYDSYISPKDYDKMDNIERQQAMLQSVVLEKGNMLPQNKNPKLWIKDLPYTISYEKGIMEKGKTYLAKNDGEKIKMEISDGNKIHAYFEGFNYKAMDDLELKQKFGSYESLGRGQKNMLKKKVQDSKLPVYSSVVVGYGEKAAPIN